MRHLLRIVVFVLVLLAATTVLAAATAAQAQQDIYSPVILGANRSTGSPIQMKEDGSGLANIPLTGDLTYNGIKGRRYFVRGETVLGQTLPDGSQYADLVAYNENGDAATRLVLTADPAVFRDVRWVRSAFWSVDGRRVAYMGKRFDLATGNVIEEGLFVGDVAWDSASGAPTGITAETLAVPNPQDPDETISFPQVSWSSDGQRFTYQTTKNLRDANGKIIGFEYRLYVVKAISSTPPSWSAPIRVHVGNAQGSEILKAYSPRFSPSLGDLRLAFWAASSRTTCPSTGAGNSIWTVFVPETYDGSYVLSAGEVTNSTNARSLCNVAYEEWSPDGTFFVFTAYTNSYPDQFYKIKTDGSAKAIQLTSTKKAAYGNAQWRR